MKLFEHPEFDQLVLQTAEHLRSRRLSPAIIEKDYHVTETLRIVAGWGDRIIFKGGTSLAKGWNLIERFSEDIDIFLDPDAFDPPLHTRAIDRELKKLRNAVATHVAFTFMPEESQTIGGFGRNDHYSYVQRFAGAGEVANRVLIEAGTASGRQPTVVIALHSYVGQFLQNNGLTLNAEDEGQFPMRLLHFRRTFVEKLFAIHGKVELLKRDGTPLGTYARHYYDLFRLAGQDEVLAMLRSPEYGAIRTDYDEISRTHFPQRYFYPDEMRFAYSDALFPPDTLSAVIGPEYKAQCRQLCYGAYPSWDEVLDRFQGLRELL